MKTDKIKKITKQFDNNRIIIEITAYDKKMHVVYCFSCDNGISSDANAMRLHKLTIRKNTRFYKSLETQHKVFFNSK